MSSGAFSLVGYAADYGTGTAVHPIKVQPETLALVINGEANDGAATSTITNPISAIVSKSRRGYGLHPRLVSFRFTGTPPSGYLANQTYRLPLVNKDIAAEAVTGATGTYLTVAIQVVSNYAPEVVR